MARAEEPLQLTDSDLDRLAIVPLLPRYAAACECIARELPDWFGMEEGLAALRVAVASEPGFVAQMEDEVVGFVTLARHFPETWEITWLAVAPAWHRRGIGRRLVDAVSADAHRHDASFILVKTLAEVVPSAAYDQTRTFYRALGFRPLAVLLEIWGPANPCLLMARCLHDTE
jgi:ribosomal protein S18 acetylase RimI-like enzyme